MATYQVLSKSVYWFQKRRDFTIYGRGGHLGHVTSGHVTSIMLIYFHFDIISSPEP